MDPGPQVLVAAALHQTAPSHATAGGQTAWSGNGRLVSPYASFRAWLNILIHSKRANGAGSGCVLPDPAMKGALLLLAHLVETMY